MSLTKVIALAGNPNVGKSTVFNELTGLRQHTGNWAGKTVTNAQGVCRVEEKNYMLVDIPGTYSLHAHSKEEEVARDFICFGNPDAVIVVCDATCLERNLNLVLQTIEITDNVLVCVNLMDEAKRKNIKIDLNLLSQKLGVPVVGTNARKGQGIQQMMKTVGTLLEKQEKKKTFQIKYRGPIEKAIELLKPVVEEKILYERINTKINSRWIALKLLDYDDSLIKSLYKNTGFEFSKDKELLERLKEAKEILDKNDISDKNLMDYIVSDVVHFAQEICSGVVRFENTNYNDRDRKIDGILTNRFTGVPIMIGLLGIVFWLTIVGANVPSQILSDGLFWMEGRLVDFCIWLGVPATVYELLIFGAYRVLAWVVSVMLPPMAIFFPLFTLLEDLGYLPRVAFNLDKAFKKCSACGKQALTMCMGFGCNAAGVVGCRIIDSPRERLIAIITNNFVPCNGRFPTLIAVITMFFAFSVASPLQAVLGAFLLTMVILFGIFMTFLVSYILSNTVLKGEASSFALELPPYRNPRIGRIIVQSIFNRTLFVLGRAVIVAAPAGIIIWLVANITIGNSTLLTICSEFLDPFARLLGLDGVILLAFILGFPANEIVVPLIIMSYMSTGTLVEIDNLAELKELFIDHGWTWVTAVCTMLFSLLHWPCSTTCLTIRKETGSLKWTGLSMLIPTVIGMTICFLVASIARCFL